jgi:four helix bundle protein
MKRRTKEYALRTIKAVDALPKDMVAQPLGKRLLRSGTSVAANYCSALHGRSRAEFIAKLGIVEEECDESLLWMELLVESGHISETRLANLMKEGGEILAITVATIKSTRRAQ